MWFYNNREVNSLEDMPDGMYGFIYEVRHKPTDRIYLGKKVLYFERNKKLGKKELELLKEEKKAKGLRGRVPAKKKVVTESDWKTYYGSHEEIKKLIKEGKKEDFTRTIIQYVPTKKLLTYYENKWLFSKGVIEPGSTYINDNIEGRYFKKDFGV